MSIDSPRGSVSPGIVPLASLQSWGAQMDADASLRALSADVAEALAACARDASGLASRVYLYRGDITELGCDAIVNAANNWMLGGAGVDGAIHDAAGPGLKAECKACPLVAPRTRCRDGDAVLTRGHSLPAKYVIHTVGPKDGSAATLVSCYRRCLALARERNVQSIAFPCIATGIYGYPNEDAATLALETVLKVLQEAQVAGAGAGEGSMGAGAEAAAAADAATAAADAAPTPACGGAAGTPAAAAAAGEDAATASDTAERPPKVRRVGEEGGASSQDGASGVEGASSCEGAGAGSGGGSSSGGASSSSSSGGGAAAPFPPLSPRPPPSSAPWRPSVVFCVFLAKDYAIYKACLPHFFPYSPAPALENAP